VSEEKITRSKVVNLWGSNYAEVTRWLGKLQQKDTSCYRLWQFCIWARKTPTELLALKSDPASREAEKLLDDFVNAETPEFTNSVKFNIVIAVKSFFKHNYRDLAKASGAITLVQQKEHKKPKKEDLRRLWDYAQNLRDKALVTFVNSTALAKETLSELKWKYFEDGWEQKDLPCVNCPSEILKGHGVGRYKGVKQITFLTPEAKRDLLNYKEWMEKKMGRKFEPDDKVWRETYKPYEPVSYDHLGDLILALSKNSEVDFSLHDARRVVETALEEVGIHPNWARKIRGRKVRGEESPYSQPEIEKLRAKYREAVPLLQFTSEEKLSKEEIELAAARMAIEMDIARLPVPDSVKETLYKRVRAVTKAKELVPINREVGNMQRQAQHEGGGLSFEQQAAKSLMRIIEMAMKEMQRKEKD
jgi:hypothetical protein